MFYFKRFEFLNWNSILFEEFCIWKGFLVQRKIFYLVLRFREFFTEKKMFTRNLLVGELRKMGRAHASKPGMSNLVLSKKLTLGEYGNKFLG